MKYKFQGRDLININDFTKEELIYIFKAADKFKKRTSPKLLIGKIIATLFFEPSTRTQQSFSAAAQRLGAGVIGFNDITVTSIQKGESFEDTIKIMSGYSDLIVIRHPKVGSARKAAGITEIPVINAGDGPNEHPTQTILDMYTIYKIFRTLNNLTIAFIGDPKHYRAMHGLLSGMSKFSGNKIYGICPPGLEMPREFRSTFYKDVVIDMKYLDKTLKKLKPDIVYPGRIPKEYIRGDAKKYNYKITVESLKGLPQKSIIMHVLPRVNEIDRAVDNLPNAMYFTQAKNGLYIREALLALILKG